MGLPPGSVQRDQDQNHSEGRDIKTRFGFEFYAF